jgi:hypothetical protein
MLGRGIKRLGFSVAVALLGFGCSAAAPVLKEPPTWRIELWDTRDEYIGAVVVELTGHRAHGAPDSPARWVEIGQVLEYPSTVRGMVGKEAEVRIDDTHFQMDLNRGARDANLIVSGSFHGSTASGKSFFAGFVGLDMGRFKARRI